MTENKHIKDLVERFLDGETTTAEEQTLYGYFARDEVADDLRPYQKMFRWYAGGMKEPLPERKKGRLLMLWMTVAASVVLLFGVGLGWYRHAERAKLYSVYEGSYIVRGGKKITDIKKIRPDLERAFDETALTVFEGYVDEPEGELDIPII